ncbi:hypothetical protein BJ875DRAFT_515840 [Amylocarpus encephaloides]|uniref:Zn(2)-C6 fungal-type domain-containing protein n=1 Tax=Amylocarpus encephaloides TaxID=45428 RepID=A0A9P7YQV2_9HELO|nr:hypothetical protein BJ875DRAFT_515840 [Amylocarpus encephaloides]
MIDHRTRAVTGLRRTHRKSRSGCKTCRGRHIRCERTAFLPRNCERSGRQCHFVTKNKDDDPSQAPPVSVQFSFPRVEATKLPSQELFLLQHLASFTPDVQFIDNKYSMWMRKVPTLIADHRFLLDVVLGVSAAHHSVTVEGPDSAQLALYYRGRGLKGLQDALSNFSETNADAVLASSIMLTWYMCDWKEWSSLTHGIRAIQGSMRPFMEQSAFISLIEEQDVTPEHLQPLLPTATDTDKPDPQNISDLDELLLRLQDVKSYLTGYNAEQELELLEKIIEFTTTLRSKTPMTRVEDQFETSKLLRMAVVTLPPTLSRKIRRDPKAMVVSAYFYGTALVVQPLFPAMGAMFFGYLALQPLTELGRYLEDQRSDPIAAYKYNWDEAAMLMSYTAETVRHFRMRLGWPTQPRHAVHAPYSPPMYSPPISNASSPPDMKPSPGELKNPSPT